MAILKKILVQSEEPEYTGIMWAKLAGDSIDLNIYRGNRWVPVSSNQLTPEQLETIKTFVATEITAADINAVSLDLKGAINGVATLDSTGKVPSAQLPYIEIDIDSSLNTLSENPVQNKVIKNAFDQVSTILNGAVFIGDVVGETE